MHTHTSLTNYILLPLKEQILPIILRHLSVSISFVYNLVSIYIVLSIKNFFMFLQYGLFKDSYLPCKIRGWTSLVILILVLGRRRGGC